MVRMLALIVLLGMGNAVAQTPATPRVVAPFPPGLTGALVFQSDLASPENPQGRTRLYTLNLASGAIQALTRGRDHRDEVPRWSPDGTRIAFKSNRGSGNFDVYVMDANGGNVVRVTDHPAHDHDPVWMPDGQSRSTRRSLSQTRYRSLRLSRSELKIRLCPSGIHAGS